MERVTLHLPVDAIERAERLVGLLKKRRARDGIGGRVTGRTVLRQALMEGLTVLEALAAENSRLEGSVANG